MQNPDEMSLIFQREGEEIFMKNITSRLHTETENGKAKDLRQTSCAFFLDQKTTSAKLADGLNGSKATINRNRLLAVCYFISATGLIFMLHLMTHTHRHRQTRARSYTHAQSR